MRLTELHPSWGALVDNFTPETGGTLNGSYSLCFDCPTCGSPRQIMIRVGPIADFKLLQWKFSIAPNGIDWTDHLTVEPSINNVNGSHGRKHPWCSFHGSIIDGEIVLQ